MDENLQNNKVTPIAAIYSCLSEKTGHDSPAAQLLNKDKSIVFNPVFVAAACVSLYDCFERYVEESKQNDFEMFFKTAFDELFKQRAEYMNAVYLDKKDEY